ncbi:MAG: permease [Gammaproteobacteria bacterium]|nr:permease [Gammaproteobacteria bacterium]
MNGFFLAAASFNQYRHNLDNRLALFTQGILIFFLMTFSLTSASIQDYLRGNLEALLGSDLVISRYQPLSLQQRKELKSHVNTVSETRILPISLTYQKAWERVQLKLVDQYYPVQGTLQKSLSVGGVTESSQIAPAIGEIWVDTRVAARLNVSVGDKIKIANTELYISAYLTHEPDRLMEGHTVDMRALVSAASFTGEALPAEGMQYRYLISVDAKGRAKVSNWVQAAIPDAKLLDRHKGQHPLASYWVRVENFFGLSSVLLFFMATIAMNMAGRRQLERQKQRLALYCSMGIPLSQGIRLAFFEWLISFIAVFIPALLLAYGAQYLLIQELQLQFTDITAGVHVDVVLKTSLLAWLLLICMQLPVFIQLKNASVISLIRQQPRKSFALWQLLWGFLTLSILTAIYSDNWLLTSLMLLTMGSTLALMMFVTWFFFALAIRWGRKRTGILPFSFFIMQQRLFSKSTQILGLGLCTALLLFTLMLMKDIGVAMHSQARAQNGNLIITDARNNQLQAIKEWAQNTDSEIRDMRPYTRAMVIKINDIFLDEYTTQPSEVRARLERPIRLSWSDGIPANNRVTSGMWWQKGDKNWQQLSVEEEVMTDLGLSFNDVVTFDLGGKQYQFTIVASHAFKPGNSSITYWFQIPKVALRHLNASVHHMGSMEVPETAWPELGKLLQTYPTLAVTSLQEITQRFDRTLAIVTKATVGFSAIILLLSIIVIVASISGFENEDKKRNGLLRSMGMKLTDCLKLCCYEWLVTGIITATGAVAGTWIAGQLIYDSQFKLSYQPNYLWITAALVINCALVCVVGLHFCRDSFKASVRELLAE